MQSVDLLPFPLPPPPEGVAHKPTNIIDAMADEFSDASDTRTIQQPDELVFRKDPESPTTDPGSATEVDHRSFDARMPV